jgi:hypothetical protein
MALNNVITNIDALLNNVELNETDISNSICIDTLNNRIGIKNIEPDYELDISGDIRLKKILFLNKKVSEIDNLSNDIIYNQNHLVFKNGIHIKNNSIFDLSLSCLDIISNSGEIIEISSNKITNGEYIYTLGLDSTFINTKNIIVENIIDDLSVNNCDINILDVSYITVSEDLLVGTHNITSDNRLKHNQIDISNGLEIIRLLKPKKYFKTKKILDNSFNKDINKDYFIEAGFISQDINKIEELNYCVKEVKNNLYALNYNNIFVYGIQAIQNLDNRMNNIFDLSKNKIINELSLNILQINKKLNDISNNINNINLESNDFKYLNIKELIINQTKLINALNNRITILEEKIK